MTSEATALRNEGLPAIGEVIAQKYRIESLVGAGGMGVVVAARHLQLGQVVAIKLLAAPEESRRAEANTRFIREAQAAAGLRSDHVVRIYDVGTLESGLPFMVMELLRGADLGTMLETHGVLPETQAVDFVLQACDAISEAHQAGIVHRDLKPSNLFVTQRSDGSALLKVLDFGISKAMSANGDGVEGSLTSTRAVMGSPYYMSPEQVRDARKVDGRADIWALGVILHETLTGEPAFQADTFPGVCAAIVADPPLAVRDRRPDVTPELEAVVMRCLEKDVRQRFQTVQDLVQALLPFSSRVLGGAVVVAMPSIGSGSNAVAVVSAQSGNTGRRSFTDEATLSYEDATGSARSGRVITGDTKTQLSADLMAAPAAPSPTAAGKSKRWLVGAAAALVTFGAVAAVGVFARRSPVRASADASASAVPASVPEPFTLTIESTPPGAEVSQGGERVGVTPLELKLTIAEPGEARTFQVTKPGFRPYHFQQGAAHGQVRVRAALVEESEPTAVSTTTAPAAAAAVAAPAPERRPAQRSAPARKASAGPTTASPPSDIRLQR